LTQIRSNRFFNCVPIMASCRFVLFFAFDRCLPIPQTSVRLSLGDRNASEGMFGRSALVLGFF